MRLRSSNDPKRPGYVYLIRCGSLYKIGLSINPLARLQCISRYHSSCHFEFVQVELEQGHRPELVHYFQVQNMHRAERALHSRFIHVNCLDLRSASKQTTEWFRLSGDDVFWFCSLTSNDEAALCQMSRC